MQQYIIRRILLNFLVLFLVATMVFGVLRIDSGNVVRIWAGNCQGGNINTADLDCVKITKAQLGLDKPVYEQYWDYMSGLVQGDLGESFKTHEPVLDDIKSRVGPSIELGILQIFIALLVALPVGIISAIRQDTPIDYFLRFFSIAFLGIPVFVIAIIVNLLSARLGQGTFLPDWFGAHQPYVTLAENPWQNIKIMFAPALLGGLGTGAVIMRFLRSQMLEVLRQDYVRTAWSKGLKERVIITRHALKNALIPVLTLIGILLGTVVSGNVVLETIYTIPGIGNYVVFAVAQNPDFPVIQGIVIVVAVALVFINLLVDISYGWLDPRIRYS